MGSLLTGWLGGRYPKHILLGLSTSSILRSIMIAAYFVLPPTPTSTLLFAAEMGVLWWPGRESLKGFRRQPVGVTLAGSGHFDHALRDDLLDKIGSPKFSEGETSAIEGLPHDPGGALIKTGFFKQGDHVHCRVLPASRFAADIQVRDGAWLDRDQIMPLPVPKIGHQGDALELQREAGGTAGVQGSECAILLTMSGAGQS